MLAITITDLPGDIYDHIAGFLPDKDFVQFLCASRQITVSAYLRRDRQRAHWKKCGAAYLAIKGNLQGLQYLHSVNVVVGTTHAMVLAPMNGHLAVVEFLHSIGAPYTTHAMDLAAINGHLAVVEFLHSVGGTCTDIAMDLAAMNGHLAVVKFLHSIGAAYTTSAMDLAAKNGHLAVVEFLHSIGAAFATYMAVENGHLAHLALVQFLKSINI